MSQLTQIPDLSFSICKDGSFYLEQSAGCGEIDRITLHSCHVRHLFELAGHLLPNPPADELAKNLAAQLCMIFDGLKEETGRSPGIDQLFFQVATVVDMLPESVYPHWLYKYDKPSEPAKSEPTERKPRPEFELTHPTTKEAKQ